MRNPRMQIAALGLTLALGAPAVFAKPQPMSDVKAASSITMGDKSFMKDVYIGGHTEVMLGKLAASKASNPKVRAFGAMMASDHSKVGKELKMLADKKGVALPKPESASESDEYKKLAGLSGKEFDKQYVKMMVDDHEDDVEAFEKRAKKGGDPNLSAWAARKLPTLKHHLSLVQDLQNKI